MNPVEAALRQTPFFDFFCLGRKFLVFNLVSKNIKTKYRRSVFGLLWTLLNPLALTGVYYFVFKMVMHVKVPHYLPFILSGVMLWSFFSATLLEGMESIVGNFGLVTKVPIPVQLFPWVGAVTNLITLSLSMPIILGVAILTDVQIGLPIVLLAFYGTALFLLCYSFSLIFAIAFVYLRDLRHLTGILVQVWFYGTPVIYDESMLPPKFHWVLFANPVGCVFTGVHNVLVRDVWPRPEELGVVCAWTVVLILLALAVQRKFGRDVAERI